MGPEHPLPSNQTRACELTHRGFDPRVIAERRGLRRTAAGALIAALENYQRKFFTHFGMSSAAASMPVSDAKNLLSLSIMSTMATGMGFSMWDHSTYP